jgi:D-sedoheptulose 7-phosphate isomerase
LKSDTTALIRSSIKESVAVKQDLLDNQELVDLIAAVADVLVQSLKTGCKVLLFGNGGSAADAQHIAAEFVGRFQKERLPLPALALTVDSSALTCIGNDYGYDKVFARQVAALGSKGDVAVGISTSGKSPNVLEGLAIARAKGLITVAFTGRTCGRLGEHSQYCICVPSDSTARIQEAHILIGHILCEIVDTELAPT